MGEISFLFSSFNESLNEIFWQNIDFCLLENQQLIVVDGGSDDGTILRLNQLGLKVVIFPYSNRGTRYRKALELASKSLIVFVHPRTSLNKRALEMLYNRKDKLQWGGFTHLFDKRDNLLRFISWWSNRVRADWKNIFYLDHIIFVKKELLDKIGGFPEVPIFEDTILSLRLKRVCKGSRLPVCVVTSSVRFEQNGRLKQVLINNLVKVGFFLRIPLIHLNHFYEKEMFLNSRH